MPITCQNRTGTDQFNGTAGAGLFEFTQHDVIPRTTRVVLTSLSYATQAIDQGDSPGDIGFWAVPNRTALVTERVLLGVALAADMLTDGIAPGSAGGEVTGNVKFCGIVLPRDPPTSPSDPGKQWRVRVFTQDKTVSGTVCVDHVLEPFPDTDGRDSE